MKTSGTPGAIYVRIHISHAQKHRFAGMTGLTLSVEV